MLTLQNLMLITIWKMYLVFVLHFKALIALMIS